MKTTRFSAILVLFCLSLGSPLLFSQQGGPHTDASVAVSFDSYGDTIHGRFYKTTVRRFAPTVILLNGYCGKDQLIVQIAQALERNGYNALTFDYSGTWSSGGIWSPKTSLQNVRSAMEFLNTERMRKAFEIDTSGLALIGNSYGGGMALLGSLIDERVKKVCSIAGADLSVWATMYQQHPEFRAMHEQILDKCMSDTARSRGPGGRASYVWLVEHRDEYDLKRFAAELATKDVLLFGGWLDRGVVIEDHILPLYRSLQRHGARHLQIYMLDDDHELRKVRAEIISTIIAWLENNLRI